MKKTLHPLLRCALAAATLCALQGCGTSTLSQGLTTDGKVTTPVFPNITRDASLKEGIYPNLDNLRAMAPGLTKNQIYHLLGRPHFREGMLGVREWDYVLRFRNADKSVSTCQYKVIFDKSYQAQSFHWLPASCDNVLAVKPVVAVAPPVVQAPPAPPPPRPHAPPPAPRKMTLTADGLFRFNGGAEADLQPEGRRKVAALAQEIRRELKPTSTVRVTGHTDRLGTDPYNDALSLARARTVRDLLMQQGINPQAIETRGMGKRQPVAVCPDAQEKTALVNCLQPNRRVDVEVVV